MAPIDTTGTTFVCHECRCVSAFSTTSVRKSRLTSTRTENAECPKCDAEIGPHNTELDP